MSANTHTVTLVEFLHARLDEDEQAALAVSREMGDAPNWWAESSSTVAIPMHDAATGSTKGVFTVARTEDVGPAVVDHIARHDPARVLAEVEAKRRIVDLHGSDPHECPEWDEPLGVTCTAYELDCLTLRLLALPYATHPDYDEEWRP